MHSTTYGVPFLACGNEITPAAALRTLVTRHLGYGLRRTSLPRIPANKARRAGPARKTLRGLAGATGCRTPRPRHRRGELEPTFSSRRTGPEPWCSAPGPSTSRWSAPTGSAVGLRCRPASRPLRRLPGPRLRSCPSLPPRRGPRLPGRASGHPRGSSPLPGIVPGPPRSGLRLSWPFFRLPWPASWPCWRPSLPPRSGPRPRSWPSRPLRPAPRPPWPVPRLAPPAPRPPRSRLLAAPRGAPLVEGEHGIEKVHVVVRGHPRQVPGGLLREPLLAGQLLSHPRGAPGLGAEVAHHGVEEVLDLLGTHLLGRRGVVGRRPVRRHQGVGELLGRPVHHLLLLVVHSALPPVLRVLTSLRYPSRRPATRAGVARFTQDICVVRT